MVGPVAPFCAGTGESFYVDPEGAFHLMGRNSGDENGLAGNICETDFGEICYDAARADWKSPLPLRFLQQKSARDISLLGDTASTLA